MLLKLRNAVLLALAAMGAMIALWFGAILAIAILLVGAVAAAVVRYRLRHNAAADPGQVIVEAEYREVHPA